MNSEWLKKKEKNQTLWVRFGERTLRWVKMIWDGRDDDHKEAASGMYFYRFTTHERNEFRKMILIK